MTAPASRMFAASHGARGLLIILGDSVAARNPRVSSFLRTPDKRLIMDLAIPGYTTIGQIGIFDALDQAVLDAAQVVLLTTGMNDRSGVSDISAAMIAGYQAAVDDIREKCPNAKIVVSKLNPAFSFFDGLAFEGPQSPGNNKTEWVNLNAAIAGEGDTPITGVDGRATSHVDQMMDPAYRNSLNPIYQENPGDLHQNAAGSKIIASSSWEAAIHRALT